MLCGGILIFQGWRLDPILLLCQILSSGTAIFFIGESLWLRSINTKDSKIWNNEKKHNNKTNPNIVLNNYTDFHKNIYQPTEYSYQDIKICLLYKTNRSWKTIHYIGPLDY